MHGGEVGPVWREWVYRVYELRKPLYVSSIERLVLSVSVRAVRCCHRLTLTGKRTRRE